MADSYITQTGICLPGEPISNKDIVDYMGEIPGEDRVRRMILRANGIKTRHYALDTDQQETQSLYQLASAAVSNCLVPTRSGPAPTPDYLSAGSTLTPLLAPGVSSLVHDQLSKDGVIQHPLEINSNAGICSSGAQALVNASRAVRSGDSNAAVAVGVEQSSDGLKSSRVNLSGEMPADQKELTTSPWFMSVFLRFMLSDGAGAFLIEPQPRPGQPSFRIDWTYSRSFANEAPLCMQLQSRPIILSQDIGVLREYMAPLSQKALEGALCKFNESLSNFTMVLPHMSSYYFESSVKEVISTLSPDVEVPYWTNLKTAGNTGSASIFIMLDEFKKRHAVRAGERILLYIPESGQFNYVFVALTVV